MNEKAMTPFRIGILVFSSGLAILVIYLAQSGRIGVGIDKGGGNFDPKIQADSVILTIRRGMNNRAALLLRMTKVDMEYYGRDKKNYLLLIQTARKAVETEDFGDSLPHDLTVDTNSIIFGLFSRRYGIPQSVRLQELKRIANEINDAISDSEEPGLQDSLALLWNELEFQFEEGRLSKDEFSFLKQAVDFDDKRNIRGS